MGFDHRNINESDHPQPINVYHALDLTAIWSGFVLIFQICVNSSYALYDGTAIKLVKQHNGNYSYVLMWQLLAACIGPYIAGILIVESEDPYGNE